MYINYLHIASSLLFESYIALPIALPGKNETSNY